jgi:hypothetical protein
MSIAGGLAAQQAIVGGSPSLGDHDDAADSMEGVQELNQSPSFGGHDDITTVDMTTKSPPDDGGQDFHARPQQQSDEQNDAVPQQQMQLLSEDMPGIGIDFQVFHDSAQGGRQYMEDVVSVKVRSDADTAHQGFAFFAVFDGHGGAEAAHFADKHLLDQITRRAEFSSDDDSLVVQAIKDGFVATHQMMAKAVGTNIGVLFYWCFI